MEPAITWDKIVLARRDFKQVLTAYLLPMLLIVAFVEGFGLACWGKQQSAMGLIKDFSIGEVVIFEILQLILMLIVIFICARLVEMVGETFHGRHTYTQAFTVVAYGLSPMFLFQLLNVFPKMNPWIPWVIGIMLCAAILYQGAPRVMLPDPPHAFGLYIVSVILLVMTTGLARFITAWYLQGRIISVQTFISNLALHLSLK